MKDRIRTFLLEGGLKAATAGICVSHWSMAVLITLYGWLLRDQSPGMELRLVVPTVALVVGIPSYYLMKLVVPKSLQTGLYDFYTGLIVGWIPLLLMWWLYL